jgi:hypothetical protein
LCDAINGHNFGHPSELISRCAGVLTSWRGAAERNDDLTMLALRFG